jgi:hypothetical protein
VTEPTGSPIAETGIELPTFSAVTSAAVMVFSAAGGSFEPAAAISSAASTASEPKSPAIKPQATNPGTLVCSLERAWGTILLAVFMALP